MADGVNIQAGDVVDIIDGKVAKSYETNVQISKYEEWSDPIDAVKVNDRFSVIVTYKNSSAYYNYLLLLDNNTEEIVSSYNYAEDEILDEIKIVRLRDNAIIVFYKYDSMWYCTVCVISNGAIEATLTKYMLGNGQDCFDILAYDKNTFLFFCGQRGSSSTTGRISCNVFNINEQLTSISRTVTDNVLSVSTSVDYVDSCVVENSDTKRIFVIYNLNRANSSMYYFVCEYNNQNLNVVKTETQYLSSEGPIHCISDNNQIAVTYSVRNGGTNTVNNFVCEFELNSVNNITSSKTLQYLTGTGSFSNGYIDVLRDGYVILNDMTEKKLSYITNGGSNSLSLIESIDISQTSYNINSGACLHITGNRFLVVFTQLRSNTSSFSDIYYATFQIFNDSICTDVKWSSKDAIALTSGTGTVDIALAGIIEANWISQGDIISSPGVCGIGVLNNVLQIIQPSPQSCQIAYGSYDGTGQYGESNPNILEFDFNPKIVLVSAETGLLRYNISGYGVHFDSFIWTIGMTSTRTYGGSGVTNDVISFVTTGSTLKWYLSTGSDARGQMNMEGKTYYYIAIG